MNLYLVDNPTGLPNTYPLDTDFLGGQRCQPWEQLGPEEGVSFFLHEAIIMLESKVILLLSSLLGLNL